MCKMCTVVNKYITLGGKKNDKQRNKKTARTKRKGKQL